MSMQDPISDMLTMIRNALSARKRTIECDFSKQKEGILKVLVEEGYLTAVEVVGDAPKLRLKVTLKRHKGRPVIQMIRRVSKPSLRRYCRATELPRVMGGYGIAILSTPQGICSSRNVKNEGGEIICEVA